MKEKLITCFKCGQPIAHKSGKIPLFRRDKTRAYYCHVRCYKNDIPYLEIGHHSIVKPSCGEWLYFWQGQCGTAKSKKEAGDALFALMAEAGL